MLSYLKAPTDGEPYLEGSECHGCGAISLTTRMACPRCGERSTLAPRRLASHGTLYSYSIVCRTFPGVQVPFVSAIVDLEGGGCVKGTLIDVPFDPRRIPLGMPVKLVFRDARFYFQPHEAAL